MASSALGELRWCAEIRPCNPLFTAVCFSSPRCLSDWLPTHLRISISVCQVLRHSVFGSVSSTTHKAPLKIQYNSIRTWQGQVSGGHLVCVCVCVCVRVREQERKRERQRERESPRCGCLPDPWGKSFSTNRPVSLFFLTTHHFSPQTQAQTDIKVQPVLLYTH